MKRFKIFIDSIPFIILIVFQSLIALGVALIDNYFGLASSNALYAVFVQVLAAIIFIIYRTVRIKQEQVILARCLQDPLSLSLPSKKDGLGSGSSNAWRTLCEAQRDVAKLLLAQKDANARSDIESFITTIHEMKAPLAAISLLADDAFAKGNALSPFDIKLEAEELDRLLELALGRIRLGDFERDATIERVDLRALASDSVKRVRRLFIVRGISVEIADGEFLVFTDRKWVAFILDQLIVNASKYAQSAVRILFSKEGNCARVTIIDDGKGIPKEDRDRIFAPSFTGASGRNADLNGVPSSGYGLHLSYKAAARLGAQVSLDACEIGGTAASILIPLEKKRFD